ncbi:hypothetical protein K435DRAFT_23489 [Dendrothele bispora CBS 962.96]|uniref:Uncharacterized protein n=1 Tax=Dendrothele bispora (strain CBS 962.96) TaxID=1314807 RepID=A0A4S8MT59_DENBC|nr:hypothetical protein K435DRAFT_23489 [Dendrothele bispora CBS 962.96]
MGPPESLEKIFQRVEEESARKAREEKESERHEHVDRIKALSPTPSTSSLKARSRRRGSVSITRFGQLDDLINQSSGPESIPTPPKSPSVVSTLAAQSNFYRHHGENSSYDSLNSNDNQGDEAHTEDAHHVTQVHRIAPRQSISRAMGGLIPRRLSRASRQVITEASGDMVIGVSVEAATVEAAPGVEDQVQATVHAPGRTLRPKASRSSLASLGSSGGWLHRAKGFTDKFRLKKDSGTWLKTSPGRKRMLISTSSNAKSSVSHMLIGALEA